MDRDGLGGCLGGVFFDWSGSYVASFALAASAGVINLAILTSLFFTCREWTDRVLIWDQRNRRDKV